MNCSRGISPEVLSLALVLGVAMVVTVAVSRVAVEQGRDGAQTLFLWIGQHVVTALMVRGFGKGTNNDL